MIKCLKVDVFDLCNIYYKTKRKCVGLPTIDVCDRPNSCHRLLKKSGLVELFLNIGAWSYKGDKVFGFWFNCKITDTDIRDAISLNKQIWWH